jgi:DNA polymerase I
MWIFDSSYWKGVELWARNGKLSKMNVSYPPSFYLHLLDPHAYWEMIEALETLYKVEECSFRTIYGESDGYKIFADRNVAEKIEIQTRFAAELYNVDVRLDQRFMAEKGIFPCGKLGESRFNPDFEVPLSVMEVEVIGNSYLEREISRIEVRNGGQERLEGREITVLSDLSGLIKAVNPDVILFPYADMWMQLIVSKAAKYGLDLNISRNGRFRELGSRSYWSYGKVNHKDRALIPSGRILIDTEKSFTYRDGGLKGVFLASRLSGLSPNLASRFTPGTLISSYEVYEAIRRGIAVPFRKRDPERARSFSKLKECDKGGMIFQPLPGVCEQVHQLDFTSMYPSIIVKYNLSPETLEAFERPGFLSNVIAPLLEMRIETKRLKKTNPEYSGMDSVLKWMLVTCFGYTGYRNAKFGKIEVHERITAISREILLRVKEIAESMDLEVLHGIVDCLWVKGVQISQFKEAVEQETGILTEQESYDWIAFLPMSDGFGAYNRYYGRLSSGKVKVRGIAARKGDTPQYVRRMQLEMLRTMGQARSIEELRGTERKVGEIYSRYLDDLMDADLGELVIHRRLSRLNYSRRCAEASAVQAYRRLGIQVAPGMELGYVVRDADRWIVDAKWRASEFDARYYRKLLEKAWSEVAFVFRDIRK